MSRVRRVLGLVLVLTVLLLVLDTARPTWTAPLRDGVGAVAGPAQRALVGADDLSRAQAERDLARVELALARSRLAELPEVQALAGATGGHRVVMARVVAAAGGTSPVSDQVVTIDQGRAGGLRPDQGVVAADGLVGRVLRVRSDTSDVLLLGDPDLVVAARYGATGALAWVGARPALTGSPGELTLTALGDTPIQVGDRVTTLGSPGSTPFAPDLPIGTVTSIDPGTGAIGGTAALTPAVETDTLDHLAVLVPGAP